MKKYIVSLLISTISSCILLLFPYTEAFSQYGLPKTGQTNIYHPASGLDRGDDGANQKGFPLSGPRFTNNGNGTVTDNATGLIWQQQDSNLQIFNGLRGPLTWEEAFTYVDGMNNVGFAGHSDWRLPNLLELMSITDFQLYLPSIDGNYFPTAQNDYYWTSTTFAGDPPLKREKWAILFTGGFPNFHKTTESNFFLVRAVRGGTVNVGSWWGLPKTGQAVSYHSRDDGALQVGYPFSGVRFIDHGNDTVSDQATGLMWQLSNSGTLKLSGFSRTCTWDQSFAYVKQLNIQTFGGHNDWRLPNVIELTTLCNYNTWCPTWWAIFSGGDGEGKYWTSTTYTGDEMDKAWWVYGLQGVFEIEKTTKKDSYLYVKAVRGLDGVGPTPPVVTPTPSQQSFCSIDSGDYDGDGTSDVALFRGNSGLWAIRGITRLYFGRTSDIPVSGDYNGDNTTDIGIFRSASGLWSIRGVTRVYFGSASDQPVPGDYNGDGRCDIALFRGSTGLWAIRSISRIYFGSSGDQPAPGYFAQTGIKNITIFRPSTGLWAIKDVSHIYFGSSSDTIVPGDYNRDGIWDCGIFRSSAGLWAIQGVTRSYFGSSSHQPVPADYTGNGADSIGVFRESSGLWAVKEVTRVYFGSTGDIPVTR